MNNASKTSFSSRTLTAAMLVMGMSFGSAVALTPATADAAAKAKDGAARYKVSISSNTVKVGKKSMVRVTLTADKPRYMNVDFPTGLKLKADSKVKLGKDKFKKTDAATLSKQKIVFEVPVTMGKAGSATVKGDLKFAICKKDSCSPVKEKITIAVKAK